VKERELARRGHRWAENIKIDVKEIDWEGVDSILVAGVRDKWLAFASKVKSLRGNLLASLQTISLSRRTLLVEFATSPSLPRPRS
jgi:hypothetical protein